VIKAMNFKRILISSNWAKVPLLLLYISFFTVQLFFNFDIANHFNSTDLLFSKNIASTKTSALSKEKKAKGKKQSIRLNKRFEPKAMPAYNVVVIKSPCRYLGTKLFVSPADVFIPAPFLLSQSFRGPPSVV
jgi:hypothetical protein